MLSTERDIDIQTLPDVLDPFFEGGSNDREVIEFANHAKRHPSIAFYGDDGFRRLNPSYCGRSTE
jgi:hypothetical protein